MWNERYKAEHYIYGTEPNDFLAAHIDCIPAGGRVLCLADGEGRNGVFLARRGFQVTSVDLSEVGLDKARRLADSHGVSLTLVHADLADFPLGVNAWEGIVSIFCHLPSAIRAPLYASLPASLTPEGVFLLEAYSPAQLPRDTGGPKDPDMLLTADTLRRELPGLDFSLLRETERSIVEGTHHTGIGAVVQAIGTRRAD